MTNRARHEVDFIATPQLPPRDALGHKGSFGSVLVIGGCVHGERTMLGGIMLAARGALRVGAGRVIAAVPAPLASEALLMLPEATVVALAVDNDGALLASEAAAALDRASHEASVTLIGPALGRSASVDNIVMRLITLGEKPLIIDADAIRAFASHQDPARDLRGVVVFTPHPAEARALAQRLELDIDCVERSTRPHAAIALASRLGAVVALKGAGTITSDGLHTFRCDHGNAALATGGSGDVLTGVIAGLFAQFATHSSFNAASLTALAVDIHARAGDLWAARHGEAGALAHEIADLVPDVLRAMRTS